MSPRDILPPQRERIIILSLSNSFLSRHPLSEQSLVELTRTLPANIRTEMRRNDSGSGAWPARVACDSSQCEGKARQLAGKDYHMIACMLR